MSSLHLITFEPGDGWSYRILFGRLPGRGLVPYYTVFGIAEGSSEPGAWYAFDAPPALISEETFSRHLGPGMPSHRTYCVAWRAWLALTNQEDDDNVAEILDEWRDDWQQQLVVAS
jgi:hypothetical protein